MKIKEIIDKINGSIINIDENTEIDNVTCDSREANEKSLFFCIKGFKTDGHKFIKDVMEKGCKSFCISEDVEFGDGINVIKTDDPKSLSYKLRQEFVLDCHGMITKCPNYNRLKEKAVALEIKNLDISCLYEDNLDSIVEALKRFD